MTLSNESKLSIVFIMILLMLLPCVPAANAVPILDIDYLVNANAEDPIHIFVNITSDQPVDYVAIWYINSTSGNRYDDFMTFASGNSTNGTWNYTIPPMVYEGTLEFHVSASDIYGSSTPEPAPALHISLDGPEPTKPFPWNIIIIVAFLAVTLVATELIFKPGLYRPTGRQKAKALEEEDRKKELENQKDK